MTNTPCPNTVIFATPGELDPISWSLMGINAKPDCNNPIGHFGTGFKMGLAVLMRENATVSIDSCGKHYEFGTVRKEFRGKSFNIVTCNERELGFTTELGKQWTMENAYRELVSNTMDEQGEWGVLPEIKRGDTTIYVTHKEFRECLNNHERVFVGSRIPLAESNNLRIYKGSGLIFYRGVKVGTLENAMFHYELLDEVKLTEDRTIYDQYEVERKIQRGIEKITDKLILKRLMTAPKNRAEHRFSYYGNWGAAMKEVVADLWENSPTKLIPAIQRQIKDNLPEVEFASITPTEKQERMLSNAKDFLTKAGFHINAIIKHISNDDSMNVAFVHGEAIHLTQRAYDQGSFYLTTTLLEEHLHTQGYMDESRRFEQYLMNELVKCWSDRLGVDL
jgi:hypothetical protein